MSKVIKRTAIDDAFVRSPAFLLPTERPGLSLPERGEDEFVLETEDDAATVIEKAEARAREIVARSRQEAERITQDAPPGRNASPGKQKPKVMSKGVLPGF